MAGNPAQTTIAEYTACHGVPNPTAVAERAQLDASDLITEVRDLDPRQLWGRLTIWANENPDRLKAACIALAAWCDPDINPSTAYAWTNTLTAPGERAA